MNAEDIEPLNKHMQRPLPPVAQKIGTAKRKVYYFYIYWPFSWRREPIDADNHRG
jgi:hypothetical protein